MSTHRLLWIMTVSLAAFADHMEVITRMLGPGRATYRGPYAEVADAVNEPKGIQRHIPIIVGGNGREKTALIVAI